MRAGNIPLRRPVRVRGYYDAAGHVVVIVHANVGGATLVKHAHGGEGRDDAISAINFVSAAERISARSQACNGRPGSDEFLRCSVDGVGYSTVHEIEDVHR